MRKERTLFIIGLWVIILPYLGFPPSWKTFFLVASGFALVYLSYLFYTQVKKNIPESENRSKTFVDNIGSGE